MRVFGISLWPSFAGLLVDQWEQEQSPCSVVQLFGLGCVVKENSSYKRELDLRDKKLQVTDEYKHTRTT